MAPSASTSKPRLPSREQVAKRAYELYLSRGAIHGHDVDDWLQAEYELMQLPIREIAKLNSPQAGKTRTGKKSLVALVRAALYMY